MSRFNPKQWLAPSTVAEVVGIMRENSGQTLLFAGGTQIHELREQGKLGWVKTVVDLSALKLNYIKETASGVRIGAGTTLNDIIAFEGFRTRHFHALVQAATAMGPEQVKNAASLGGALACGVLIIDLVSALLALGARVATRSVDGAHEMDLWDLLKSPEAARLGRQSMIEEIRLERSASDSRSCFRKFCRSAADWPVVNACVSIQFDASLRCSGARLVMGSRPEGYFRLKKGEELLLGKPIREETLNELAQIVPEEIDFKDHFTASAAYKRLLAKALYCESLLMAAATGS